MRAFLPEGQLTDQLENKAALRSQVSLAAAMAAGTILEARATLCDSMHNLTVELGCMRGIIPREEAALGIGEGLTRDIAIISRVNKPVCFKVIGFRYDVGGNVVAVLSRVAAQKQCMEEYISRLRPGDVIPAQVTHLENFGAFVDIGCGIVSLIPIDCISVSRIFHPSDRFSVRQKIYAVVKNIDSEGRICLSHKELLGTWEENAARFDVGETVAGIVRSVEEYGIFVELTPNLAGLAERKPGVVQGQRASVYIKSIIPEKMKVKLVIVEAFDAEDGPPTPLEYYITEGKLDRWQYSPPQAEKNIYTSFI